MNDKDKEKRSETFQYPFELDYLLGLVEENQFLDKMNSIWMEEGTIWK